ncbi:MAG: GMC family oxidoreductase [Labilithrix sp.]|nr:GMC family oxidoreductase [Labilithrix sp.]
MAVVRGRELRSDVAIDADAVVVGTGAGGSIAMRELARAGLKVVALEEGGRHVPQDFDQREERMLPMLFQDGGGRATEDLAIRVLGGRGVGGSTIHNTNLCKRTPDPILALWARDHGVEGAGPKEMIGAFERIEEDLSVSEIPEGDVNANNDALRRGLSALGWKGAGLKHNRVGCQKSGFCELGCAYDAKQNAMKVVVPQALAAGADLYADVDVRRVLVDGARVIGVEGLAHDGARKAVARVRVRANVVVLAGSAIGSAALARRSGLPDPHGRLGRGLRMHPGGVVAGRFDEKVLGHKGIPQSYECTELLSYEPGSDRRVWIVPAFAHPIATAAMLPGFGAAHMRAMRSYGNLAVLTAMVHDETAGEVDVDDEGEPVIRYRMSEPDRAQLAKGLVACARILLAAGAREVTIPAVPPVRVTTDAELDRLDTSFVRPHAVPLSAVHPMGTLAMGRDPRTSVVSSTGEHHQVRGLFVLDGSLFPTSLGGPPQISIYAFALHLAPHAVAAARR